MKERVEMVPDGHPSESACAGRSRREFLRDAVAAGGVLIGGPALLAGSAQASAAAATAAAKPKLGGDLRVGVSGGGSQDILDAHTWSTQIDGARVAQLYDFLAIRDHHFRLVPMLGTEFTPNAARTDMVVKLRPDVVFHNGKAMTSEDVVFTFNRILDPKVGAGGLGLIKPVIGQVEAVDRLTVRFTFKFPFNDFEDMVGDLSWGIVPVGYDPKRPIGTGPFKYQSFTPGQQSVFVRNENYWGTGVDGTHLPYVDSVTIVDLSDETARFNALVSGAVDAIDSLPYALLPVTRQNSNLEPLISETGNWYPITMRVDQPPFTDPRVRQAMKWIVDRPQMIKEAYAGQARLANDLFSNNDLLYDHALPQREQDIEKAKFLLKQAGHENLTLNLVTAPIENGVLESSVVFAAQAKAAGVNVQLTKLDNTTFYGPQYLKRTFSVDWWSTNSWIVNVAYTCGPDATYNETHYSDAKFNRWYGELLAAKDESLQKEIAAEMQAQLYDDGGWIFAGFPNNIDAYSRKVTGFVPDPSGYNLSYWGFKDVWFV